MFVGSEAGRGGGAAAVGDGFLDHREVFAGRGLEDGSDLPRVALADQGPDRRSAIGEGAQVGIVLAAAVGAASGSERREPGSLQGLLAEACEKLLILGVRSWEATLLF